MSVTNDINTNTLTKNSSVSAIKNIQRNTNITSMNRSLKHKGKKIVTRVSSKHLYPIHVVKQKQSKSINNIVKTTKESNITKNIKNIRTSNLTNCKKQTNVQRNRRVYYEDYYTYKNVKKGLNIGSLFVGEIRINSKNRAQAFVTPETKNGTNVDDLFICGSKHRNRAFEGDRVVVKLLSEEELKKTKLKLKRVPENLEERGIKYAKVVYIIQENLLKRTYIGTIEKNIDFKTKSQRNFLKDKESTLNSLWLKPIDKRVPLIYIINCIKHNDNFFKNDQNKKILYVSKVKHWPKTRLYPLGYITSKIGLKSNIKNMEKAVLWDNSVDYEDFDEKLLQELQSLNNTKINREIKSRLDLRKELVFTIDPDGARDLDDAISIRKISRNLFRIGVHIADVSYFVKNNTLLDNEAKHRSTSVYLVDRVIPMLPSVLCDNLCSLHPKVDRLAFSVIFTLDKDAEIKGTEFKRSIINSKHKLSYEEAQKIIDAKISKNQVENIKSREYKYLNLEESIIMLNYFSRKLREKRFAKGALSLSNSEVGYKFILDSKSIPVNLLFQKHTQSHELIEELMLLANKHVAFAIYKNIPKKSIFRCHPHPSKEKLENFSRLAKFVGYDIDVNSIFTLNKSLESVNDYTHRRLLKIMCKRTMKRAKYIVNESNIECDKLKHYALNFEFYTHFTSPIRRYADLIVHRLMTNIVENKSLNYLKQQEIINICNTCNARQDNVQAIEERIRFINFAFLLKYAHKNEVDLEKLNIKIKNSLFIGIGNILQISENFLIVYLDKCDLEIKIKLDTYKTNKHHYYKDGTLFLLINNRKYEFVGVDAKFQNSNNKLEKDLNEDSNTETENLSNDKDSSVYTIDEKNEDKTLEDNNEFDIIPNFITDTNFPVYKRYKFFDGIQIKFNVITKEFPPQIEASLDI